MKFSIIESVLNQEIDLKNMVRIWQTSFSKVYNFLRRSRIFIAFDHHKML